MEQNERKGRECYTCNYYRAYYTKEITRFEKRMHGFCNKWQKEVGNREGCASWCKIYRRRTRRVVSVNKINEMITDIAMIRQILCEDQEALAQEQE